MTTSELKQFFTGIAVTSSGKIVLSQISKSGAEIVSVDFNADYNTIITFSDGDTVKITDVDMDSDGKIRTIFFQEDGVKSYVDCTYDGDYLRKVGDVVIADVEQLGIKTSISAIQDKTIIPGAETQIVTADENYDALGTVIVAGSENLVPENIKRGVDIFGILGTFAGSESSDKYTEEILYASDSDISGSIILANPFTDYDFVIYYIRNDYGYSYICTGNVRCYAAQKSYYTQIQLPGTTRFSNVSLNATDPQTISVSNYNSGVGIRKIVGMKFDNSISTVELYSSSNYCLASTVDITLLDSLDNYDYLLVGYNYYDTSTDSEVIKLVDIKMEKGKRIEIKGYSSRVSYLYLYPDDSSKIRHIYSSYRLNRIVGIKL